MKPVEFQEQSHLMGKDQPEFDVLPVCIMPPMPEHSYPGEIISVWELSEAELELIKSTKRIYVRIQGQAQPPIILEVENPFIPIPEKPPVEDDKDENQTQIINLKQNN